MNPTNRLPQSRLARVALPCLILLLVAVPASAAIQTAPGAVHVGIQGTAPAPNTGIACKGEIQNEKVEYESGWLKVPARFKAKCDGDEGATHRDPPGMRILIQGIVWHCISPTDCQFIDSVSREALVSAKDPTSDAEKALCVFLPPLFCIPDTPTVPFEYELHVDGDFQCDTARCYEKGYILWQGSFMFEIDHDTGHELGAGYEAACDPPQNDGTMLYCQDVATKPWAGVQIPEPKPGPPLSPTIEKICDDQLGRPACY